MFYRYKVDSIGGFKISKALEAFVVYKGGGGSLQALFFYKVFFYTPHAKEEDRHLFIFTEEVLWPRITGISVIACGYRKALYNALTLYIRFL